MELEIKHLVPYLECNLRLERISYKHERFKILTAYDLCPDGEIDNIKPILHPLSDLTKEIEVNGEKFVPYEKIKKMYPIDTFSSTSNTAQWSYRIIQKLFEWHFDIFGLIEDDLAIDINTLNK
jgi:hypothetical protein